MIISGKLNTPQSEIEKLRLDLKVNNLELVNISNDSVISLGVVGDLSLFEEDKILELINSLYQLPWVTSVTRVSSLYKLASREFHPQDTVIEVKGVKIGGNNPVVFIGGPCAVETKQQIEEIAIAVKEAGGVILRGGAYKPRTSPYSFQGLKSDGILLLKQAGLKNDLPIISEIMSVDNLDEFVQNVDIIQVGARNMQNFELLKALGKVNKPILLKRGFGNTIEEWLMSAEHIMASGNNQVILCERGIRTFEKATRNTIDIAAIPIVKKLSHLPIIVDPSHAAGKFDLVESIALASIAAGCDGLMIEVHNHPECALSDGVQSLKPEKFANIVKKGKAIQEVVGK